MRETQEKIVVIIRQSPKSDFIKIV